MTRPRLPIDPAVMSPSRRGGGAGGPASQPVPSPSETVLLNCDQVSRRLGIGRTKTFQLMARGILPTVHIGRCARARRPLTCWLLMLRS